LQENVVRELVDRCLVYARSAGHMLWTLKDVL
jgi:hypothetical protein